MTKHESSYLNRWVAQAKIIFFQYIYTLFFCQMYASDYVVFRFEANEIKLGNNSMLFAWVSLNKVG